MRFLSALLVVASYVIASSWDELVFAYRYFRSRRTRVAKYDDGISDNPEDAAKQPLDQWVDRLRNNRCPECNTSLTGYDTKGRFTYSKACGHRISQGSA